MAYSRFNHPSRVVKSLAAVALIIVLLIRGQQAPKPAEAEIYGPPIPDSITYNEEFCTPIFVQAVKATLPELKLGQLSRKTGFAFIDDRSTSAIL